MLPKLYRKILERKVVGWEKSIANSNILALVYQNTFVIIYMNTQLIFINFNPNSESLQCNIEHKDASFAGH